MKNGPKMTKSMKNGSKMSKAMKADMAMDKKKGIKEGSPKDQKIDEKVKAVVMKKKK